VKDVKRSGAGDSREARRERFLDAR